MYLTSITLSNPGLATSDPLYVLYGNFADETASAAALDAARLYVRDTFAPGTNLPGEAVPEPTSIALLGLGAAALLRRKR